MPFCNDCQDKDIDGVLNLEFLSLENVSMKSQKYITIHYIL